MDRSITVRYFEIEAVSEHQLSFDQAVAAALALGAAPHDREREIAPGVVIRLERAGFNGDLIEGEVVRVQRENIPPEAQDGGLVPLGIGGLGHSVAFSYDPISAIIAIQFDPRGVSLGRFLDYLVAVAGAGKFSAETIINEDAWERYNQGEPRSLTVSIAAPQNLEQVQGPASSLIESSKRLAEIAHAPVVTIQVSMGHIRKMNLAKAFVDNVLHTLMGEDAVDNVRSLSVKTKAEGLPSDTIDFINDFARDQDVLGLPSDNHEQNIIRRLAFVRASFNARIDAFRQMYA